MSLPKVEHRVISFDLVFSLTSLLRDRHAPACISSFPLGEERWFAFVSGVTARAVGVDPTDSTNGVPCEEMVPVRATTGIVISAASVTTCDAAERNRETFSEEVEARD